MKPIAAFPFPTALKNTISSLEKAIAICVCTQSSLLSELAQVRIQFKATVNHHSNWVPVSIWFDLVPHGRSHRIDTEYGFPEWPRNEKTSVGFVIKCFSNLYIFVNYFFVFHVFSGLKNKILIWLKKKWNFTFKIKIKYVLFSFTFCLLCGFCCCVLGALFFFVF